MKNFINLRTFSSPKLFLKDNNVLVDGLTRSGKLLLGSLISSFQRMESFEVGEIFEHFMPGLKLRRCSLNFTKNIISLYLNQLIYNKMISRNVNFRKTDRTSVQRFFNSKIYYKRLNLPEGQKVLERIKKTDPILPIVTHEIMVNYLQLKKLNFNLKIIELYRNPFETTYSWYKRGHGKRFGNDPLEFTSNLEFNKRKYPWYLYQLPAKWHRFNDLEKCAYYVSSLNEKSIKQNKSIIENKNIYITNYNLVTEDTFRELKNISKFLKTDFSKKTVSMIKRENCPNLKIKNKLIFKKNFIKKRISSTLFNRLIKLENSYLDNTHGFMKKYNKKNIR